MRAKKQEDSLRWSLVIGLTVIVAGVTTFVVVNKHEIFPEQYSKAKQAQQHSNPEPDTLKTESEHHH